MVLVITSRLLIAHREALLVVRLQPSSVYSNFNRGDKGQRETRLHNFEPDFLFKLFRQRPLPAQFQVFFLSVAKRHSVRVSYWGRVESPLSDIVTNARRARNKRLRERTRAREPRSSVRPLLSSTCCATQATAF